MKGYYKGENEHDDENKLDNARVPVFRGGRLLQQLKIPQNLQSENCSQHLPRRL